MIGGIERTCESPTIVERSKPGAVPHQGRSEAARRPALHRRWTGLAPALPRMIPPGYCSRQLPLRVRFRISNSRVRPVGLAWRGGDEEGLLQSPNVAPFDNNLLPVTTGVPARVPPFESQWPDGQNAPRRLLWPVDTEPHAMKFLLFCCHTGQRF